MIIEWIGSLTLSKEDRGRTYSFITRKRSDITILSSIRIRTRTIPSREHVTWQLVKEKGGGAGSNKLHDITLCFAFEYCRYKFFILLSSLVMIESKNMIRYSLPTASDQVLLSAPGWACHYTI